MDFASKLVEGRFKERLNRFLALVDVDGQEVTVHVPSTGRMRELLVPEYRVLITPRPGGHRKTGFDLALVDIGSTLASTDARLPNALLEEALIGGRLPQFRDYPEVRREVTFGESRLDLLLEGPGGRCYLGAKAVNLVVDGTGLVSRRAHRAGSQTYQEPGPGGGRRTSGGGGVCGPAGRRPGVLSPR